MIRTCLRTRTIVENMTAPIFESEALTLRLAGLLFGLFLSTLFDASGSKLPAMAYAQ